MVEENTKPGTSVAAITVTDKDAGAFGEAKLQIVSGNRGGHFSLHAFGSNLYVVRVANNARVARDNVYNITVRAADMGNPPRTATDFLVVRVSEVNDHEPVFERDEYEVTVDEDVNAGSEVVVVKAVDEDGANDDRNKLVYSISDGNDKGWFRMHPLSGLITTKASLDRERQASFRLTIRVQDVGSNPKSAFATVRITIADANDERPRFSNLPSTLEVAEDSLPGTVVYTIEAVDNDLDENGTVTYGIAGGNGRRHFGVHNTTGEVTVLNNIDRETMPDLTIVVRAEDGGRPPLSSVAELRVNVLDVNDNSPVFYPTYHVVRMSKRKRYSANRPLFTVRATDEDLGNNARLTYSWSSASGPEPGYLSFNASTGEVFVSGGRRLPRRGEELEFSAVDGGGRRSRQNVTFLVVPVDPEASSSEWRDMSAEPSAVFDFSLEEDSATLARYNSIKISTKLYFAVNERRPHTLRIVHIMHNAFSRTTRNVGSVTLGTAGGGEFKILDGDRDGVFSIDAVSGAVTAVGKLDREVRDSYRLKVAYFSEEREGQSGGVLMALARVKVLDRNDNQPVFTDSDVDGFSVDVSAPAHSKVYRAPVSDPDEGPNGKLQFVLEGDHTGTFEIDRDTGVISLSKAVHPNARFGALTVRVSDGGSPRLSGSRSYAVRVTSVENRHTPSFDFDHYEISLSERTPPNAVVMSLKAVDEDTGRNGDVLYAVEGGATDQFDIFPDGRLYLKTFLDREDTAFYSVTVVVKDKGAPTRSSTAMVVIYVTDENDNPPLFDSKNYVFELRENEPAGTIIGRVSADDSDVGRNAELTFGLTLKNEYFSIDPSSGFLKTKLPIDREDLFRKSGQDYFQVDGTVHDGGIISLSDTASINIVILDINDHSPRFTEESYEVSLSEGAKVGTEIIKVHANDRDKNDNGRVRYDLEGEDSKILDIDPKTGVVTLGKTLDREAQDALSVAVVARDFGSPVSLSSSAMLRVNVLDENDHAPKFARSSIEVQLSEASPVGRLVHKFEASDEDSGQNGRVSYFLGGTAQRSSFHLDSSTGALTLAAELDRELRDRISLVVSAVDGGVPSLTSSTTVNILVLDENDNAPVFPTTTYLVNVQEGVSVGSGIFQVSATDADQDENGKFDFSLIGTEDFQIDTRTGELSTRVEMDREAQDSYAFTVAVTDRGSKVKLKSEKSVTVVVEDVNDHAPRITSLTSAVVLPGTRAGATVARLEAEDEDAGSNGAVTFELGSGGGGPAPNIYDLNRRTGKLTLIRDVATPDRGPVYLEVIAKDEAVQSARRSATTTLTIVGGRSQPGPSFSKELYRVSVKENSPMGTPVGSVQLVSSEASPGARFYLVGCDSSKGQNRGIFVVDPVSGQVRTGGQVDRETEGDLVVLQIVAIDGNGMSTSKMEVTVLDENDSAPVFGDALALKLSEAFLPGQHLANIVATDEDLDPALKYSLDLRSQTFMAIDENSGAMRMIQSIDREEFEYFELTVTASDGVHSTNWTRRLEVEDMNDNAPIFSRLHFSFDVAESATRGAIIGRIDAEDLDKEPNFRQVSYSLVSDWGSDTFSIDPNTGVITLSSATGLDFEYLQHYVLIAQASDAGNPPLTATCTVYINVVDLNDNPPVMRRAVYEAGIGEDVAPGTSVLTIEATDADSVSEDNLTYELDAVGAKNAFGISDNGTIFTVAALDREKEPSYTFRVTVRDEKKASSSNGRGHSATCMVQVTVGDVNDNAPEIDLPPQHLLTVVENSPPNTAIARIAATDKDQGRDSTFTAAVKLKFFNFCPRFYSTLKYRKRDNVILVTLEDSFESTTTRGRTPSCITFSRIPSP